MTGGPHLSRSQDHPQNGEGNALMVKTGRKAKMALDSVQGPNSEKLNGHGSFSSSPLKKSLGVVSHLFLPAASDNG